MNTVRVENTSDTNADIYTSDRASISNGFRSPVFLSAFNSSGDEIVGALTADGCTIYINRIDPGTQRSHAYVAVKPAGM